MVRMMVCFLLMCIVMVKDTGLRFLDFYVCFMHLFSKYSIFLILTDHSLCRHLNAALKENETDDELGSNGSVLGFPPRQASYSCLQMNGKEVFRFAVRVVPQSIEYSLAKAGLPASSIDWLLLHQV